MSYIFRKCTDINYHVGSSRIMVRTWREIADRYLQARPYALSVFRAAELQDLSGRVIERPVLDLGCGHGEFATAAIIGEIDCGLDVSLHDLRLARRTGKYLQLCHADARSMPFSDATFRAIVAISVLEHVFEPRKALAEAFRILKPGGHFFTTIVISDFHQWLLTNEALCRRGWKSISRFYLSWHDRLFRHVTLHSQAVWESMFLAEGFELCEVRQVVSPQIVREFDRFFWFAWPYRLAVALGVPGVWRLPGVADVLKERMAMLLELEGRSEQGGCLFIVARKPNNI